MAVPVAFYAPLKAPDDPVPSGDREMARLMMRALAGAGFAASLASRFSSFDRVGVPPLQAALAGQARDEIERLIVTFRQCGEAERPRLWFTYHVYYKAPDFLGPPVAAALGIPYVVAEGSHAAKRAAGPWSRWHEACETALRRADLHVLLNPADRAGLDQLGAPDILPLAPFLDAADWPAPNVRDGRTPQFRMLAVAMMRQGDKLASYRLLAAALAALEGDWSLDVVGDGAARGEVEALLRPHGARIRFHGLVEDRGTLADLYARADVLAWPAVNEAFGMAFLEAALQGCPAVAGAFGGVPAVVADRVGGLLVAPGNARAFAAALARLQRDHDLRRRLGIGARRRVLTRHTVEAAAAQLRPALTRWVA
ncbi:glycosyltransferase family 4 protein [Aureimonas pseudogalii]|uniref:Glycosyltransferase involved in cell wall biosynthesis n=1 Tax=Aureimonas pseudogalii TaxID=1744844 RepID=A0A7W6EEI5_9HYPH|nr:glycosyltransferase family 4 protein [Aureimonas pseudogalii]MBB3996359.1 glycosyltransferase involved in cell wall biosynthesis [Aureimonas pseudogalii]